MTGNLIANVILAGALYGLYIWTPWASLLLASLSSVVFSYSFLFDKEHIDQIAPEDSDKVSVILGAGISYLGVIVSVVALMK